MSLLRCEGAPSSAQAPPPATAAEGGPKQDAAEALGTLGLPSLLSTLQGPATLMALHAEHAVAAAAAAAQPPSAGRVAPAALPGALPVPPLLVPLAPEYQEWYLCLAQQRCSVCGEVPREPALCMLCGALLCAGGSRKCMGPSGWVSGMLFIPRCCFGLRCLSLALLWP